MNRGQLFFRLLLRAAWVRKDRALTALVSVAVVATIATAALTIYSELEGNLSREFRSFGANVVVSSSAALDAAKMQAISKLAGEHSQVVPVAYAVALGRENTPVVIGGTDVKAFRELHSSWSMNRWGYAGTGMLLGARAATP
jgi:putative ABC transport system permease protein